MMKRHVLAVLALSLTFGLQPAIAAVRSPTITRPASSNVALRIRVLTGSVRVVGWGQNKVRVLARLSGENQKLRVTGDRNHLSVSIEGATVPTHEHANGPVKIEAVPQASTVPAAQMATIQRQAKALARQASKLAKTAALQASAAVTAAMGVFGDADLTIYVPRKATIDVTTISAPVTISHVDGVQRLKTVSGVIKVISRAAAVSARSVTGGISIHGSGQDAYAHLATVSGPIGVSGFDGNLSGESMAGSIRVDNCHLHRVHLSTTSGNVVFNSPLADSGNYRFSVWSGNLSLHLPRKPNAEFHFSTFSGKIKSNIGPKPKRSDPYLSSTELQFRAGSGKAYVHAESMTGSITLVVQD